MSYKYDPKRVDRVLSNRIEKLLSQNPNHILPITQMGEPVLRTKCKEYKGIIKPELLKKLIANMKTTMRKAPGVGLAAPQIGLDLNLAVLEDISVEEDFDPIGEKDERETRHLPFFTAINPHYEPIDDETKSFYEGCLSFGKHYAIRTRYYRIMAFWTDEKGKDHQQEMSGWPARIFQHETDHLSGEIYIDKAIIRSLTTSDNLSKYEYDNNLEKTAYQLDFTI